MTRPAWRGHVALVGDEDDRAARGVELVEQAEDLGRRARVEVARRLVGQDQGRLGDERPGDGDALLLAAGQLAGPVADPVGQADLLEARSARGAGAPPGSAPA